MHGAPLFCDMRQPVSRLTALFSSQNEPNSATATRHLTHLLDKACLIRLPGGGRSTRYRINTQDISNA